MINIISDSATIVFLGSFNPGIFHPAWFEKNELMLKTETDNAKIELISNDVAMFSMSWVRIEVVGERFMIRTNDESKFGPLRDLVMGIFHLLEFTPVSQVGLNREIRFQLPDLESWHAVGHKLAPKEPWSDHLKTPGLKLLTMEALRDDGRVGAFNISVAAASSNSVIVSFNDHLTLDKNSTAAVACEIISQDWEKSLNRAKVIATDLISTTSAQT